MFLQNGFDRKDAVFVPVPLVWQKFIICLMEAYLWYLTKKNSISFLKEISKNSLKTYFAVRFDLAIEIELRISWQEASNEPLSYIAINCM